MASRSFLIVILAVVAAFAISVFDPVEGLVKPADVKDRGVREGDDSPPGGCQPTCTVSFRRYNSSGIVYAENTIQQPCNGAADENYYNCPSCNIMSDNIEYSNLCDSKDEFDQQKCAVTLINTTTNMNMTMGGNCTQQGGSSICVINVTFQGGNKIEANITSCYNSNLVLPSEIMQ